ncbi:MAG: hypothetical protein VW268_11000 [Rhodospirillaceae bacterium]
MRWPSKYRCRKIKRPSTPRRRNCLPVPDSPKLASRDSAPLPAGDDDDLIARSTTNLGEPMTPELALWREVEGSRDPEAMKVYLLKQPNGAYADVARVWFRNLLEDLSARRAQEEDNLRDTPRLRRLEIQNARLK